MSGTIHHPSDHLYAVIRIGQRILPFILTHDLSRSDRMTYARRMLDVIIGVDDIEPYIPCSKHQFFPAGHVDTSRSGTYGTDRVVIRTMIDENGTDPYHRDTMAKPDGDIAYVVRQIDAFEPERTSILRMGNEIGDDRHPFRSLVARKRLSTQNVPNGRREPRKTFRSVAAGHLRSIWA